jgi:RimJ/RimL family protein N-acetyltransferase
MSIPTLLLFGLDRDTAEHLAREPDACALQHHFTIGLHKATMVDIAAATAAMLTTRPAPMPWGGYLALEGPTRRVVGTCGFNGGPDAVGAVELAYFAFPGEEHRGIATAMATELVRIAESAHGSVVTAYAHTLPERNASCRVLEKAGFAFIGEVIDPDDGPVWRWERPLR